MIVLHFGPVKRVGRGSVGRYGLHIQCPWRLEGSDGVLTGRSDLWTRMDPAAYQDDSWDYDIHPNLLDSRLNEILGRDEIGNIPVNSAWKVVAIVADKFGGIQLRFRGGRRLTVFPSGSDGEHWRLLGPGSGKKHFVVGHQGIEEDDTLVAR